MFMLSLRHAHAASVAGLLVFLQINTALCDPAPADLAIRDVTIISPERAQPMAHADLLIRSGKIVAIEPHGKGLVARRELNGHGRYLTPGLIDGHVHLYHATGLKRRYTKDYKALYAEFQRQQPRSYLYFGYTTVVELNADADTNTIFNAQPRHPDLYHCSQALVLSNGFMAVSDFDSEAEFLAAYPNFLHDRFTTPQLPAGFDPAEHTPAATVAKVAARGGRCIKLYYEEALWWPGKNKPAFKLPSARIVREVVREAHARGMPVLLHGTTPEAHNFGRATGVDIMAHGIWDWDGAINGQPAIPTNALAAIDADAANGIAVQPTYQTVAGSYSLFDPHALDDPRLNKVLSADYLRYLHGDAQQGRADYIKRFGPLLESLKAQGKIVSTDPSQIVGNFAQRFRTILTRMSERHTHFLFGTDTATGGNSWGNPPGLNGFWEMRAWNNAGIPLATIFRAATLDNAKAFRLENELGTVETGKRANLLLMDKNPLKDISAYDSIETIILGGDIIARADMAAD